MPGFFDLIFGSSPAEPAEPKPKKVKKVKKVKKEPNEEPLRHPRIYQAEEE